MRIIKKILISLFLVLLLVIGSGIILSFVFKEEVNEFLISELNKKIITQIDVEEVKFSLLRKFPNASIEFKQVLIHPPTSFNQQNRTDPGYDTLFFARNLFLEFNVRDIIQKDFRIKKVHANRGKLFLRVNRKGMPNYQFWKIERDTSIANFEIRLQDLKFSNLQVNVLNHVSEFALEGFAESLNLKGDFSSQNFQLGAESKLFIHNLSLEQINYIRKRMCRIELEMAVEGNRYTISEGDVNISGLPFTTLGSFTTGEDRDIDLVITGKDLDLASVISILPDQYRKKFKKYKVAGYVDFNVSLDGGYGLKGPPQIIAQVSLDQTTVSPMGENIKIKKLKLDGNYTNGKRGTNKSTNLKIENFSLQIGSSEISGSFEMNNLERPEVELLIAGTFNLSEVYQFFKPDSIEFMEGLVKTNLKLTGPLKDHQHITRQDIQNLNPVGQAVLKGVSIKKVNDPKIFSGINGTLMFAKHIWLEDLSLNLNGNQFVLNGKLGNAVAYLVTGEKPLLFDADLSANEIVLDRFRFYADNLKDSTKTIAGIDFPDNLKMNLRLDVKNYSDKKFNAKNVTGLLSYQPGMFALQSFSFSTMEGQVSGGGMMEKTVNGRYSVRIQSQLNRIDIKKLFASFSNFGQEYIIDEHINGSVSGEVDFSATWDSKLKIEKSSIIAESHVIITDGELVNFEPMLGLSRFIEVEELQQIKFSKLENEILIKDKKVTIPQMEVHSSAINVTLSGMHDFDNNISYKAKVLLSEILFQKAKNRKKENEEFGVVEDDDLGKTSLYLTITGKPGDINIAYDRKEVKQAISESIQEERKVLQEILKEEFGWFKKDTTGKNEQEEPQIDRFLIQWDDTDTTLYDTIKADTLKRPAFRIEWPDDETETDTTGWIN